MLAERLKRYYHNFGKTDFYAKCYTLERIYLLGLDEYDREFLHKVLDDIRSHFRELFAHDMVEAVWRRLEIVSDYDLPKDAAREIERIVLDEIQHWARLRTTIILKDLLRRSRKPVDESLENEVEFMESMLSSYQEELEKLKERKTRLSETITFLMAKGKDPSHLKEIENEVEDKISEIEMEIVELKEDLEDVKSIIEFRKKKEKEMKEEKEEKKK